MGMKKRPSVIKKLREELAAVKNDLRYVINRAQECDVEFYRCSGCKEIAMLGEPCPPNQVEYGCCPEGMSIEDGGEFVTALTMYSVFDE